MRNVFIFYCSVFLIFISCTKENKCHCIKTTGKIIKKEILLSDFNEIQINNIFDVYITNDTVNKIVIEGGKNIVPFITSEVNNQSLKISNKNKCNWLRSYKKELNLYISAKSLNSIIINGESNIYSTNTIICHELNVVVNSGIAKADLTINSDIAHLTVHAATGDYTLRGKTGTGYLYSFGTCYIMATDLECDFMYITNKSTGNDFISVKKEIGAEINGSGNIYYNGNPATIKIKETSSGRLIKQ